MGRPGFKSSLRCEFHWVTLSHFLLVKLTSQRAVKIKERGNLIHYLELCVLLLYFHSKTAVHRPHYSAASHSLSSLPFGRLKKLPERRRLPKLEKFGSLKKNSGWQKII